VNSAVRIVHVRNMSHQSQEVYCASGITNNINIE